MPPRETKLPKNEFLWLRDHAKKETAAAAKGDETKHEAAWKKQLQTYCHERARGVPLQYILGSEFFGDLEIKCQEGVFIPRPETASIVTHLARMISLSPKLRARGRLQFLDVCTGSGCIPLLLQHELQKSGYSQSTKCRYVGLDSSPSAIKLAKANLKTHRPALVKHSPGSGFHFEEGDLLAHVGSVNLVSPFNHPRDILISNPPYVSAADYLSKTAASVRDHEPKAALVPPELTEASLRYWLPNRASIPVGTDGVMRAWGEDLPYDEHIRTDVFYHALLQVARSTAGGHKTFLFEVGDDAQARRIAKLCRDRLPEVWRTYRTEEEKLEPAVVEIWRDQPTLEGDAGHILEDDDEVEGVSVRGKGNMRAVFAWQQKTKWFSDLDPVEPTSDSDSE